jgi:hypothetical protein
MLYYLIALGLLLGALCWVVAASALAPRKEEMVVEGAPVVVEYATSVTADALKLPFHAGSTLEQGFAYTVRTEDGREVSYYASALLTTRDAPGEVAASYQAQLPGRPEPEVVEDEGGKRYVLAVGGEGEVRRVSITEYESGSRIQLTRATRPSVPPELRQAPSQPRFRMPRSPRRGPFRGPGRRGSVV